MPRRFFSPRRPQRRSPDCSSEKLRQLGERLAHVREARGFSRAALAACVGIGAVRLAKIESGTGRLEASLLYRLALALNVQISELFAEAPESQAKLVDPELTALARYFDAIPQPNIRKTILNLAKSVTENS